MTELFDHAGTMYRDIAGPSLTALGRSWVVPAGVIALTLQGDGEVRLASSGEKVRLAEVVRMRLYRVEPAVLTFDVADVTSQDGFACSARLVVALRFDVHDLDALVDFSRTVERFTPSGQPTWEHVNADRLASWLAEDVALGLKKFVATAAVEQLHEQELLGPAEPFVQSALRKPLLTAGLVYGGLRTLRIRSVEFEGLTHERAETVKREQVSQLRQRMRELWDKDRRQESLSQHEFQEFMKALEHDGLIRDLDRQRETLTQQQALDAAYLEYERQQHDLKKTLEALE